LNASIRAHRALRPLLALAAIGAALALPPRAAADDPPAAPQRTFASAEEAKAALVAAAKAGDHAALREIFGPDAKELVSGDPVEDAAAFDSFAKACGEAASLAPAGESKVVLTIGAQGWPFPIPIVKSAEGRWLFDTAAGKEEILNRRVGENELKAIGVCRAYVQAQREYASKDRKGDEVLEYAQRLTSSPGKKDGLYWPAAEGEEQSPFGPLVAEAQAEGYGPVKGGGKNRQPYHGYLFRILKRQGASAPAGAYDYVINGHMIAGFALVAYPAVWGQSGIMTFIVNQQGKVYEKNLGAETAEAALAMTEYEPDKSWTLAKD
jgi:hypothetical protein